MKTILLATLLFQSLSFKFVYAKDFPSSEELTSALYQQFSEFTLWPTRCSSEIYIKTLVCEQEGASSSDFICVANGHSIVEKGEFVREGDGARIVEVLRESGIDFNSYVKLKHVVCESHYTGISDCGVDLEGDTIECSAQIEETQ